MPKQQLLQHQFANGMTLVGHRMPWLQSAAFALSVSAGSRFDAPDKVGTANFLCEMVQRGCGDLDSRQYVDALQMLGVDSSSTAGNYQTHYGGAMIAKELLPALRITADVLRRPLLPAEQLEEGRMVCMQEIAATADDLAQQAMDEMKRRFYGDPDGRNGDGTLESLARITMDDLKDFHARLYRPNGMILGVAGSFDWQAVVDEAGQLFDDWTPMQDPVIVESPPVYGQHHIPFESEQTHIIIAFKGYPISHPDYYLNRCAIGVLSDGMSSRLFTEVREKRGLCYTVYARNHMTKNNAGVFCYSGTSAPRAQETLDVIIEQVVELGQGVTEDELNRLKIQIRSGLVSQQESCRSRANSINSDWFHLGRLQSMDELNEKIAAITVDEVNDFLARNCPSNFSLVTIGSAPLELKEHGIQTTPIS